MPRPTIFLGTNTGSNSKHADCIRNICDEITNSPVADEFVIVQSIHTESIQLLEELHRYRDDIAVFHFGGRHQNFQELLVAAASIGIPSLPHYLAELPNLELIFLSYCSTANFVNLLRSACRRTIISTSHRLRHTQATQFATSFYRQYLIHGTPVEVAFEQAVKDIGKDYGKHERHYAGLYSTEVRQWWIFEQEPRIFGTPEMHLVGGTFLHFDIPEASLVNPVSSVSPIVDLTSVDDTPTDSILSSSAASASESSAEQNIPLSAPAGLPVLPAYLSMPDEPFPGVRSYQRNDARIFFGRNREIGQLYDYFMQPKRQPILLLYGQAGVGKSSLLKAGLLPYTEQRCRTYYLNGALSPRLFTELCQQTQFSASATPSKQEWMAWLAEQAQEVLFIVDQVETPLLSTQKVVKDDLKQFMKTLQLLLANSRQTKNFFVIFSARQDCLDPLYNLLVCYHLQSQLHEFSLKPLNETSMRTILHSFAPSSTLATHYNFAIENEVAERIVAHMIEDPHSPMAPFLQAILVKLWEEVTTAKSRSLSFQRYQQLYREGALLRDFLKYRLIQGDQEQPPTADYRTLIKILFTYTSLAAPTGNRKTPTTSSTLQLIHWLRNSYLLTKSPGKPDNEFQLGHQLLEKPISQEFYRLAKGGYTLSAWWAPIRFIAAQLIADVVRQYTKVQQWFAQVVILCWNWLNRKVDVTWGLLGIFLLIMAAVLLFLNRFTQPILSQPDSFAAGRQLRSLETQPSVSATATSAMNSADAIIEAPGQRSFTVELKRVSTLYGYGALPLTNTNQRGHILAFSPDSALLFAGGGDNTIEIWRVMGLQAQPSLLVPAPSIVLTSITSQGDLLIYTTQDGSVGRLYLDGLGRLRPTQANEPVELLRHKGPVTTIQISNDAALLVTGGQDGVLYQYDLQTRQLATLRNDPADPIAAAAIHPNKQSIAYVGVNQQITLWERTTATVSRRLAGHTERVNSLEFSQDGSRLLSASSDGTVCIWQLVSGTRDYCFGARTTGANGAHYSPDGTMIVVAKNDGSIELWDALRYRLVGTVDAHPSGVSDLAISADNRYLASAGWDSSIALWEISIAASPIQ